MAWTQIHRTLKEEWTSTSNKLLENEGRVPLPPNASDLIREHGEEKASFVYLREVMVREKTSADEACRHFARDKKWPIMTSDVGWVIFWRLQLAWEFVEFVIQPRGQQSNSADTLPADMSDDDLTEWLLIDFWNVVGLRRWDARNGI
jgi:hypothetical protein